MSKAWKGLTGNRWRETTGVLIIERVLTFIWEHVVLAAVSMVLAVLAAWQSIWEMPVDSVSDFFLVLGASTVFCFVLVFGGSWLLLRLIRNRPALSLSTTVQVDLGDEPEVEVTASLSSVPPAELVHTEEASRLVRDRWPSLRRWKVEWLVIRWLWKWRNDTTHSGIQDGKFIRQPFLQWVEETITQPDDA